MPLPRLVEGGVRGEQQVRPLFRLVLNCADADMGRAMPSAKGHNGCNLHAGGLPIQELGEAADCAEQHAQDTLGAQHQKVPVGPGRTDAGFCSGIQRQGPHSYHLGCVGKLLFEKASHENKSCVNLKRLDERNREVRPEKTIL